MLRVQRNDHGRVLTPLGLVNGERISQGQFIQLGEVIRHLPAVVIVLALLAIFLGVMSVLRAETLLYSGMAATLGIGAIAFQMSFFYAVVACVTLIMYAALERPGGAFSVAFIAVCAILVPSILALLGTGLIPVLLLIGAAMATVSLDMLLGRHENPEHPSQGGRP